MFGSIPGKNHVGGVECYLKKPLLLIVRELKLLSKA